MPESTPVLRLLHAKVAGVTNFWLRFQTDNF